MNVSSGCTTPVVDKGNLFANYLTYVINSPQVNITFQEWLVINPNFCGSFSYSLIYYLKNSLEPLPSFISLTNTSRLIQIYTINLADIGNYSFSLVGTLNADVVLSYNFTLEVI